MNRRQKALLMESILVLATTVAAVVGLMHLKDYINRSEALRAMNQLGEYVLGYRTQHGSLPPESFVNGIKDRLEGVSRLGSVKYRALYIGPNASGGTVLAYSFRRYSTSFLADGYVVLRLDGTVEWMQTPRFADLFDAQRLSTEPNLPRK